MHSRSRWLWWASMPFLVVLGLSAWYAAWLRHELVTVYGEPDPGLTDPSIVRPALWLFIRLLVLLGAVRIVLAIIRSRPRPDIAG